ncbi:pilus assembly FimT family protein [Caloramator proteoclasticus]|uniref:Prepilin-type N-terminal cleavage/methylation domain-containing protein n=1 Tax=Caloramator proteoclasticus DSM 10124 TaxID=1121262 RepID=A0A1M4ZKJ5_9CLOT|nr:prepilin-type N-terminal cleavage/methylation domain-containing protein [Caloramator proteoclasticus]SHF18590.1 prepilin-type N-terminal cleavage/methylation domain-containing protein [Caloramator proteoclasticus DSM 10124]
MRKKGFTLIEMTIVVAILGILLSIAYMNFTKSIINSRLDSAASEIASMLRDVYENGNKSMDYNTYYVKINKNEGTYRIELIKKEANEKVIRSAEYKDININFYIEENENNKSKIEFRDVNFIFFTSEGGLKVKYSLNEDGQEINLIQISNKSENNSKRVYIDKIPAGNIRVE